MSEIVVKQVNALIVSEVAPGSPAEAAGVLPGDLLRGINGRQVLDVLDYRFHATDPLLTLDIERDGERLAPVIRKRNVEDSGLAFEFDLGDRVHTCKNRCVFCFIHQQPKRMRRSLYLMDDDFRLSFMHGNYVTLTNLSTEEWARILEQRLSPLYVSVHATDPELRGRLLGRKEAAPVLPQIRELAQNRISVHAQVVLCPGLNDGAALWQTIEELAREHPVKTGHRAGVESLAIVPVGLTRFRERLPALQSVERDYARRMVHEVRQRALKLRRELGTRFVWLADEWYVLADVPIPSRTHYEEFPQLEDGIGTIRLFLDELNGVRRRLRPDAAAPVEATLVTAEMPAPYVRELAERWNRIGGVHLNVCVVRNRFFGGDVRVAGLLTATDILDQLDSFPGCRHRVYLPNICLRDGQLFLDDLTLEEARRQSRLDLRPAGRGPRALAAELGLLA